MCPRSDMKKVSMQATHTHTHTHTALQQICRQTLRFHAGHCGASIMIAQDYQVTFRRVQVCYNALNTKSFLSLWQTWSQCLVSPLRNSDLPAVIFSKNVVVTERRVSQRALIKGVGELVFWIFSSSLKFRKCNRKDVQELHCWKSTGLAAKYSLFLFLLCMCFLFCLFLKVFRLLAQLDYAALQ